MTNMTNIERSSIIFIWKNKIKNWLKDVDATIETNRQARTIFSHYGQIDIGQHIDIYIFIFNIHYIVIYIFHN